MTTLPETTLAHLRHYAAAGQHDAKALLHLLARADARDKDVAVFVDSYSRTIAALCRRLEALERGAKNPPAAPVDAGPVANALIPAEAALADVAEGDPGAHRLSDRLQWTETRCTEALAAIRPVMKEHGIRTSEFPTAAPAPAPAAPGPVEPESEKCETCDGEGTIDETLGGWSTDNPAATCPDCDGVGEPRWLHRQAPATPTPSPVAPAGGLLESIAQIIASDSSEGLESFQGISKDVIHRVAEWLDVRGHYVYSVLLRKEIDQ